MKLLMHSFDFEECTLTFSVPVGIMKSRGFANVPGGVEVDLAAITKDASLGIVEAQKKEACKFVPIICCGGGQPVCSICGKITEAEWK